MPNQRKAGKKLMSAWIAEDNRDALYAEAQRRGKSVADLLDEILKSKIKTMKKKADGKTKKIGL